LRAGRRHKTAEKGSLGRTAARIQIGALNLIGKKVEAENDQYIQNTGVDRKALDQDMQLSGGQFQGKLQPAIREPNRVERKRFQT